MPAPAQQTYRKFVSSGFTLIEFLVFICLLVCLKIVAGYVHARMGGIWGWLLGGFLGFGAFFGIAFLVAWKRDFAARAPLAEMSRAERVNRVLWLIFKIGLSAGILVLILGAIMKSPSGFTAVAEAILAISCAALALESAFEGYVYARRTAKSVRFAISGAVANAVFAVLLGSGAVTLAVMAIRDWF
jgi:hypothetical protein